MKDSPIWKGTVPPLGLLIALVLLLLGLSPLTALATDAGQGRELPRPQPIAGAGEIIIAKVLASPALVPSATFSFNHNISPAGSTTLGSGNSQLFLSPESRMEHTFANVPAGSYTVTEDLLDGWRLYDLTCDDPTGDSVVDVGARTAHIELAAGEQVYCTFQNGIPGTIIIEKIANPVDGTIFNFTDNIRFPNAFTLSSDTSLTKTFDNVPEGVFNYAVYEQDTPGWPLTGLSCSGGNSSYSSDLALGYISVTELEAADTVICTFTNTQCQPGTYDAGGNACVLAPAGSFVPTPGATQPTECSPGSWQDLEGQDGCNEADPGFFVPGSGATEQTACPDGFTSEAGATECTIRLSGNTCPVYTPRAGQGSVGSQLTTLTGLGMGSPTRQRLMGKIIVPNTGDLTDLYGQLAAKEHTAVKFVRFIYPEKNAGYIQVDPETDLGEKAAISWWGADLDESELLNKPTIKGRFFLNKGMRKMKTPRAFVLYMTHQTEALYANNWSTFTSPDNFVAGSPGFPQTNTNVLPIPETQATTDIVVQLAVTDVNRDPRTIDVTVSAGGVSQTVTLTGPTNKKSELLNLVEVTLEDVPAGVDEVEILLESALSTGDSAALLGAAAHYECVDVPVDPDPTFTLGDRFWYDQNQNGRQDADEPGYNGITVELYGNATCSGLPIASTTTLAGPIGFGDGFYQFSGLLAGDYCLAFSSLPSQWVFSPTDSAGDDVDSDASGGQIGNISLSADDDSQDAGAFIRGELAGSVVCTDSGTRSNIGVPSTGIQNVTVTLAQDFDGNGVADGPAIATTSTDINGFYSFTGLEVALAGDSNNQTKYVVQVDTNDPDLGACDTPLGPTQYNPELHSNVPLVPNLDFEFERTPV